jgi:hypothetical protein
MGEYFRSWKRKIGVVTLLLACLFMSGWIRSLRTTDFIIFNSIWPNHAVLSGFGRFRIFQLGKYTFSWGEADQGTKITYTFHEWSPLFTSYKWTPVFRYGALEHSARQCEVFEVYDDSTGTPHPMWMFPYWSIALPLTALSAFLLLTNPHQTTPKKTSEPISGVGGTKS